MATLPFRNPISRAHGVWWANSPPCSPPTDVGQRCRHTISSGLAQERNSVSIEDNQIVFINLRYVHKATAGQSPTTTKVSCFFREH